ncbi:protease [Rhypophila decipiens]
MFFRASRFLLLCAVSGVAIPLNAETDPISPPSRRGLPLQWPAPIPVDRVGPIDWSILPPPSVTYPSHYPPPRQPSTKPNSNLKQTATTSNSSTSDGDDDDELWALYSRVDWRNRTFPVSSSSTKRDTSHYQNFITTPQNQGRCASCWAFAATALIEAQVRIEHGIWSKRSESDIHDGVGASCESVGNIHETLAWMAGNWDDIYRPGVNDNITLSEEERRAKAVGVADWACDPYEDTNHGYEHCSDRAGRATHIPGYTALGTIDDQKRWLREYGPVVATFVLYLDFERWGYEYAANKGKVKEQIYRYDETSGNTSTGNHIALVVGYDDHWGAIEGERAGGAWIVKNSWGAGWGDGGYVYFGYNEANIDGWIKYGIANVSPDSWSRKRHQSGNMMQSSNGLLHRNFELLLATSGPNGTVKGFSHLSRDGTSKQWDTVAETIEGVGVVGQPVIVGTSYNKGDFHALVQDSDSGIQHWVLGDGNNSKAGWALVAGICSPSYIKPIEGQPDFVQADDSSLVMVVRHSDGSLREWQRPSPSPSNPSPTWRLASAVFTPKNEGSSESNVSITQSGASLIQSNIGHDLYSPKGTSQRSNNLYVVAIRSDGKIQLFWRPGSGSASQSPNPAQWNAGEIFGSDLILPSGTGNRKGSSGPAMIQSFSNTQNETSIGDFHLVVVAPKTGTVQHWRRRNDDIHFREPTPNGGSDKWELLEETAGRKGSRIKNVWSLVQGSFNGRMHMVTEQEDGGFGYWEWDPQGEGGKRWAFVEALPRL